MGGNAISHTNQKHGNDAGSHRRKHNPGMLPLPLVSHSHCWRDVPVNVTVWGQKLLPLVILSDHNYPGLQSSRRQRYFFISSGTSTFHYRRNFNRVHYDEDIFVQAILASWFEPDDRSCQLSAISRLSLQ